MTPAEWKVLIAGISLAGLTPRVDLAYADSPWGPVVVITRYVVDTTRPKDSSLHGIHEPVAAVYPLPADHEPFPGLEYLAFHVQQNLGHEVLEHFRFKGERVLDPHQTRPAPQPHGKGPWSGCGQPGRVHCGVSNTAGNRSDAR